MTEPTHVTSFETLFSWIAGGVTAVFAALTTAISMLYREERSSNKERIAKLEASLQLSEEQERQCKARTEELASQVARLEERLALFEEHYKKS